MARVRDARTTRAGSHAEVMHQAGVSTARGSVMQGSGMEEGGGGAPRLARVGVRCCSCSPERRKAVLERYAALRTRYQLIRRCKRLQRSAFSHSEHTTDAKPSRVRDV
eukprot:770628-Prymnesium_polylepis.1